MIEKKDFILNDEIESNTFPYKILIVDNDQPTLLLLKLFFKSQGYSSYCTRRGIKSLEKLSEFIPKLILIDLMVADISPFKLCKKIKSNKRFKHIPLIYLTSFPASMVKEKLEETKADGCITKPFEFESLEYLLHYLD
ncbi:MAG: PleD family two-component system response regulator [Candidatus Odinarchaeota archaeon]